MPSSQWYHPSSHAASPKIPEQMPIDLSHPGQPHTRPAPCHFISAPELCPAWLPVDSTLGWLLFSPGYG